MARDLLIGVSRSVTGQWVRTEVAFNKNTPYKIVVTGSATAGNVIIEELVGGMPTSAGPLPGNPGALVAGSQTGTVVTVTTIPVGGNLITLIQSQSEYLRASTDTTVAGGTVDVRLLEAQ